MSYLVYKIIAWTVAGYALNEGEIRNCFAILRNLSHKCQDLMILHTIF